MRLRYRLLLRRVSECIRLDTFCFSCVYGVEQKIVRQQKIGRLLALHFRVMKHEVYCLRRWIVYGTRF